MRVRDHIVISTIGAAILYPRLRGAVLGSWAASILIDADHYVWFCLHQRRLSPRAAVRFFNQAQPPQHPRTRLLHSPAVLLLLLLSVRWRRVPAGAKRRVAVALLGMAFHVAVDVYDAARREQARAAARARDGLTCQHCGAQGPGVVAHLWRQPRLLPSYRPEYFTSLCGPCHEAAHAALRAAAGPAAAPRVQQRPKRGARRHDAVPLGRMHYAPAHGPCSVEMGARSYG